MIKEAKQRPLVYKMQITQIQFRVNIICLPMWWIEVFLVPPKRELSQLN